MLTTARWRVNRGKEKNLCCSCERLLVSDTIGAKSEVWGNCDGNKERISSDQRDRPGKWASHASGNGTAAGGSTSGMAAGGSFASYPRTFKEWRGSRRRGETRVRGLEAICHQPAAERGFDCDCGEHRAGINRGAGEQVH